MKYMELRKNLHTSCLAEEGLRDELQVGGHPGFCAQDVYNRGSHMLQVAQVFGAEIRGHRHAVEFLLLAHLRLMP